MLEEVRSQGEEAGKGGFYMLLFGCEGDEDVAEELVGMGEVVSGEQDGSFRARST